MEYADGRLGGFAIDRETTVESHFPDYVGPFWVELRLLDNRIRVAYTDGIPLRPESYIYYKRVGSVFNYLNSFFKKRLT